MKKCILSMILILFLSSFLKAQTMESTLEIRYNSTTCLYEAHLHVGGTSLNWLNNLLGTAGFCIVVPTSVPDAPIACTSVSPGTWTDNTPVYNVLTFDGYKDYHKFATYGGQFSPDIAIGDDIILFTFSLPTSVCPSGIRMFENNTPSPSPTPDTNPPGLTFDNSIQTLMGETYVDNLGGPIVLPLPQVSSTYSVTCNLSDLYLFADGSTTLGCSNLNYLWSGPGGFSSTQQNPIVNPYTAPGTYTVTVTDANKCTSTSSVNLGQPQALTASATAGNATCGLANGSVNLTVTGGTLPYSYNWSNGAASEDLANVAAGTYTVTVTDFNSCSATATATVNSTGGPTATITAQTNVACFGNSTGTATVTHTGGTPVYSYLWNTTPAQSTVTATGLAAGTYSVTVTDANTCTAAANVTITQPAQALSAVAIAGNATCSLANGSVNLTVTGGTPSYTYAWSNGANTEDLANVSVGTYTVTVIDSKACQALASATVNSLSGPLATITSQTNVSCYGNSTGNATVSVSGGTPGYTYLWSTTPAQSTATATGLAAGTYSVTVTDANTCTATTNVTITQPAQALSAVAIASNATCGLANGSVNLTVTGGTPSYTYAWSNAANTEDLANVTAGTYIVTITDAKNCLATASATVNSASGSTATITAQTNVSCYGTNTGSATVSISGGTPGYTYLWNTAPAQTTATATGLAAGTYSVTVTDANTCTATAGVTITQPAQALTAMGTATQASCGLANGAINLTVAGGTPLYSYAWSNGANTEDLVNVVAGTYTVTVMDAGGCSATATVTVNNIDGPVLSITAYTNVSCYEDYTGSVTVSVTGGTPGYNYLWNTVPAQTTATASGLSAGTYTVVVSDAGGCSASTSVTIAQDLAIQADGGQDQEWCNVNTTFLIGNTPSGTTGSWSQISGPNTVVLSPVNSPFVSVGGMMVGTYEFVYTLVTINPGGNCFSADTVTVINYHLPSTAYAGPDQTLCLGSGSTTSATVTGNIPAYGYGVWEQVLGPTTADFADSLSPATVISNLAAGEYGFNWVIYSGPCEPHYDYIHIIVNPGPTVNAGPDGQTCQGVAYALSGATASNYQSVSWTSSGTGMFSNPIDLNPTYTPSLADVVAGSITLTVTASGMAPCPSQSDGIVLTITANPAFVCPPDITQIITPGSCTASIIDTLSSTVINATCIAGVTNSFTSTNNASGSYPVGTTIVTWTVTYADGSTDTCNQTITVIDTIPPVIICPTNLVQITDAGACYATVTITDPTATDNCSATFTFNGVRSDSLPLSAPYPVGVTTITWTATDVNGNVSASCTQSVTVYAPPIANLDMATTDENTPVVIDVLNNDTDCDNNINPATVNTGCPSCALPSHGIISINSLTGDITYTPSSGFYGTDTLIYEVCDSGTPVNCDTALVIITVTQVNNPPVTVNEHIALCQFETFSGNIITNGDYDPEGMPLLVSTTPVSGPAHGSIVIQTNGFYTYTPFAGYFGPDMVVIALCDNGVPPACGQDTIFITVNQALQADAGHDQQWCNVYNTFLAGNAPVGTSGNWAQLSGPNLVSVSPTVSAIAGVTGMIPGTYQFVYTLTSVYPAGNCVTTDTMTVINYALPSTSYAGPDQVLCLNSGSTTATTVSGNIPASGYGVWEQVLGPTTAIIGDSLSATTILSNLAAGEYGFNWVIYSGPCEPHYDYIHITVNAGPTADAGPDGQTCQGVAYALSSATASNYQSVSWTSSGTGVFSNPISQNPAYTPSPADVSTGYVVLTLTASGTAPCPARSDSMVLTINANPVLICPPDIAVAADLSSCTAQVVDTLTGIAVNTTCVATITNSFNATDDASGTYPAGTTIVTWTITYADGTVDTCNQTITVYSPLVANLDISATQEDTPVVVDVLSNDTDCDSNINPGTVNTGCPACTLPANGTITIDPLTGAVTYTPDANFYGTDTLIYEVCDSGLPVSCDTALVIITVTPVNDPPVVEDSTVTIPPDSTIVICLPITDVDGPMPFSLSATGCVQNGTATAVVNGNLVCITYTPDSAWTGIDTVCVTICDGLGSCDTGYLIINVIPDTSQSVVIGVAKTITEVIVNTDHSYEVHYSVIAENLGNTMLTDVALFENLSNTFPLPTTFSISVPPVATGTLIANTAFDGVSDTNLLLPSSTLATGAADTVTFAVKIVVDGYFGPFDNVVTGIGENNGIFTTDTSDNGVITDANGNNNPNEPGENDPTILVLSPDPEIGLAKELVNVTEQYDGSYIVVFNLTVENLGNDTLYNVQVTDDLSQAFPSPATFQVVSAPVATGTLTANDSYNGVTDINLLDNTASMLDPGQTEHIQFKVRVFTHSVRTRTFYNIAVTEALGTMGIAVTDTSTEGTITDINGNGIANEELENNPTPIELKPFPIRIPDGFSPNGDDINDFFVIPNIENYPDCELSIYNRWGNLIYRKSSYDNSWDGTPNVGILLTGKQKVQPGTYYYILDFNYEDMEPAKGYVVVQY